MRANYPAFPIDIDLADIKSLASFFLLHLLDTRKSNLRRRKSKLGISIRSWSHILAKQKQFHCFPYCTVYSQHSYFLKIIFCNEEISFHPYIRNAPRGDDKQLWRRKTPKIIYILLFSRVAFHASGSRVSFTSVFVSGKFRF